MPPNYLYFGVWTDQTRLKIKIKPALANASQLRLVVDLCQPTWHAKSPIHVAEQNVCH